ncbi:peptidoglycan-binding domain-containing protein [Streptomyces sp. NPDC055189]
MLVLPASGAQAAAYPTCNADTAVFVSSTRFVVQPVYSKTGSSTRDCVMGRGAQSKAVRLLQKTLNTCYGLDTGGQDGIYGEKTESAVRTVQGREGASVDGEYGPETRRKMDWIYYRRPDAAQMSCAEPGV